MTKIHGVALFVRRVWTENNNQPESSTNREFDVAIPFGDLPGWMEN